MSPGKPELHALLIGIDCYLPNQLPGGYYYPSLGGCVRDISHVEEFLRAKLGMPQESILKLTATNTGQPQPLEPQDQWPTYENMVARLKQLTTMALPGDQVYIHYLDMGGVRPLSILTSRALTGWMRHSSPRTLATQRPGTCAMSRWPTC